MLDVFDKMMYYEQDLLSQNETIELFQVLIDEGSVWRLQGSYGRMAKDLIYAGLCHA